MGTSVPVVVFGRVCRRMHRRGACRPGAFSGARFALLAGMQHTGAKGARWPQVSKALRLASIGLGTPGVEGSDLED